MPLTFSWISRLAGLQLHIDPAGTATARGWIAIALQVGETAVSVDVLSRQTRAEEAGVVPVRSIRVGPLRAAVRFPGGPNVVGKVLLDLLNLRPDVPRDPAVVLRRQAPWLRLEHERPILPGVDRYVVRAPWWWPADVAEQARVRAAAELGAPVTLAW